MAGPDEVACFKRSLIMRSQELCPPMWAMYEMYIQNHGVYEFFTCAQVADILLFVESEHLIFTHCSLHDLGELITSFCYETGLAMLTFAWPHFSHISLVKGIMREQEKRAKKELCYTADCLQCHMDRINNITGDINLYLMPAERPDKPWVDML